MEACVPGLISRYFTSLGLGVLTGIAINALARIAGFAFVDQKSLIVSPTNTNL
jgi:hypothetical protein